MPGSLKKYAYINAKLRTRLSKILTDDFFDKLIRTPSLPECVELFRNTPFGFVESVYNQTGDIKLIEIELFKREVTLYRELIPQLINEVASFVLALAAFYEIDNLKKAMRLWFDRRIRGRSIDDVVGYLYREKINHILPIDAIVNAESLEEIVLALQATPYADIIQRKSERMESLKSIFPIEIGLDHYYYEQLLTQVNNLKGMDLSIARRMIGVEIDIQNMNWIIRFKNVYDLPLEQVLSYIIPQGFSVSRESVMQVYSAKNPSEILSVLLEKKYSSLQGMLASKTSEGASRLLLIESILEQIIRQEVRRVLGGYPFTIGIILAYFILKRNEIRKIMTLLNAKYYGLPAERIKSAL